MTALPFGTNPHEPVRGRVYLVGAGPGDPGLLTVAAARILRRADVVVHDALIGEEILDLIPASAQRIDVGKRCGGKNTTQEDINRILIEAAREHSVVVRLKGGDPFVFGRGGEEALALREARVPFRVVPGVTAGVGVSAFAGIPVTHRGISSSVTFVTGHEERSRREELVDWDAVARVQGTLVVYMGVGSLESVAARLVTAGRSEDTPAAIVEWGTFSRQRVVTAPLSRIAVAASESGIGTPALVVIGEVVALREQISWFDRAPLRGRRIVVARSRPQPSRIAASLRRLGAEVLDYPELRAVPAASSAFDQVFADIGRFGWLVFSSPAGVRHFWGELERRGLDARSIASARIAAFGAATEKALRRRAIAPDVATRTFEVERVVSMLDTVAPISGMRVLFPREGSSTSHIATGLRENGAVVDEVPVFVTERVENDRAAFFSEADAIVLPSSTAAAEIAEVVASSAFAGRIVAMGPSTAQTALAIGLKIDGIAADPSVRAIVRAVRECLAEVDPTTHDIANLVTTSSS